MHTASDDLGLRKDIASVLNRYSRENGSDSPDFILADYLSACLDAFDAATARREKWYGRGRTPIALTAADVVQPMEKISEEAAAEMKDAAAKAFR